MANVLIVDDSMIMRRSLRNIIENSGHTVIAEASNGNEAIAAYKSHSPDIVTMDISMPSMNGLEALKNIKSINSDARVIIISAYSQKEMVLDAIENGAKSYILKPVNVKKVKDAINLVLG